MSKLVKGCSTIHYDGKQLDPISLQRNKVGFCDKCELELESLAYYRTDSGWLVSAQCNNGHFSLMSYDHEWNWRGDQELQIVENISTVQSIPKERLEVVFTTAEIRDLLAYEQGQPYTRQNIYRARAKYEKFEKLFGIKLNI